MDFQRWFDFERDVLKPAMHKWGSGWDQISLEMRASEVRAACFQNMASRDRLEQAATDADEAAEIGRHAARLAASFEVWWATVQDHGR